MATIASPELRSPAKESRRKDRGLRVCALEYRPPDVVLGNDKYGPEADMWSLGCVAYEIMQRQRLFNRASSDKSDEIKEASCILDQQFRFLGTPPEGSSEHAWFSSLPLLAKLCGRKLPRVSWEAAMVHWPPNLLLHDAQADVVSRTLRLLPQERLDAASACLHPFLVPHRCLTVAVSAQPAQQGSATILEGPIDDDLLEYLQQDPKNAELYEQAVQSDFAPSKCMKEEGSLRNKSEFPGYLDGDNPPPCKNLNSGNLKPISSRRLKKFGKAMRRLNREWQHQLTCRIRQKLLDMGMPSVISRENGKVFSEEDLADLAFVYVSQQFMKTDKRGDGKHVDGGCSLLHAALGLFGCRDVELEFPGKAEKKTLHQRPGDFYVGNLCAIAHEVQHDGSNKDCFSRHSENYTEVKVAIMFRTDVFRQARARRKNATPGPADLYRIVYEETARHLVEVPFVLPDLAAVVAETA